MGQLAPPKAGGGQRGDREESVTNPHAQRRGSLLNGNPSGDYMAAARCGARTRRQTRCLAPAMGNGRCRLHGGLSTGPRTPEASSGRMAWPQTGQNQDGAVGLTCECIRVSHYRCVRAGILMPIYAVTESN